MMLSTYGVRAYLVGGAVRDRIMGKSCKDFDFAIEARSYEHMDRWLTDLGFQIFTRTPETLTIRARCEQPVTFAGIHMDHQTYDFTLCRKDGTYSDGRHPDSVTPGTILDDLARRDFTCNAIALREDGTYLDPHGGQEDIALRMLRLVGGPERLIEDGLRVIRAVRFFVTTGFDMDGQLDNSLFEPDVLNALSKVSADRIRDELNKMLKHSPQATLSALYDYPEIVDIAVSKGIWFKATSENR